MEKNILLAGAGQLGSRHLQALALLDEPCKIHVVDPSSESLNTARQRFEAVDGFAKHEINYHVELRNVNINHFDLVIVATNANIRSKLIKELLQTKSVSFFILEKVLFQTIREYVEIGELLETSRAKAFVNCTRRMYEFYRDLKDSLCMNEPVQMEIIGNNWGLGSNSIHFIDLFNFITGDTITGWRSNLDKGYIDSKRDGYKEFTGNLYGFASRGNSLSVTCFKNNVPNVSVRISTPTKRFFIAEGLGRSWGEYLSDQWKIEEIPFPMPYQSGLTQIAAKDLFAKGTCMLTPYQVSASLHVPFLKVILTHYNCCINKETDICPIT